jgi:hypothetical protein
MTKAKVSTPTTTQVYKNGMLLSLDVRAMGNHRKIEPELIMKRTGASRAQIVQMLNVTKKLIVCDEYAAIQSLIGEVRRYINLQCLPSPLKAGTFILPIESYLEVAQKLDEYIVDIANHASALAAVWDERVKESKERLDEILPGLFNKKDYMDAAEVEHAFGMSYTLLSVGAADVLATLNPKLYAIEQAKIEKQMQETMDEMRDCLRLAMKDIVDHMVDRLKGKNGKPHIFRNTVVTNVQEFLATFTPRNGVVGDGELARLADQARKLVDGLDPKTLRDSEDIQKTVLKGFTAIKKSLDTMLVAKPKRNIKLA